MTTTTPIPTSIAAACAAHDRHRLDVLDALLDEVAPSAVRELLGAALDLCATLRTERDEREEAVGATFAKHRAEIDAATAQLAAARQVIDEERATVARQTARVAELETRPVLTAQALCDALVHARAAGDFLHVPAAVAADVANRIVTGGAVTLPAQDRAEELARLIAVEPIRTGEWKALVERTRAALVSLGAPATTPTAAIDRSLALTAASLLRDIVMNGGLAEGGEIGPRASDYLDMMRRLETTPTAAPAEIAGALSALNARLSVNAPTLAAAVDAVIVEWDRERAMATPTAAPGLVAAVSEEELACAWFNVHGGDVKPSDIDDRDRAHVRAVLARLNATTIAPVDPEAVARSYHDHEDAPTPEWDEVDIWRGRDQDEQRAAIAAMRATLTVAGIPVTPEVGK